MVSCLLMDRRIVAALSGRFLGAAARLPMADRTVQPRASLAEKDSSKDANAPLTLIYHRRPGDPRAFALGEQPGSRIPAKE
jgi:hypothetical protein